MSKQAVSLKEANKKQASSLLRKNIRKFVNNKLAMLGLAFVVIIVAASVLAPVLTSYDPNEISLGEMSQAPSAAHILGTDKLGRDVFSRVLYGGRVSVFVGVVGALSGSLIGMVLGSIAGYFGGKTDALLIRASELFQTFPEMILIMILVSILGQGVGNLILVFSITGWMTTFRMVRNEFLALREETYVQVCEAFGMSKAAVMFKQILPNVLSQRPSMWRASSFPRRASASWASAYRPLFQHGAIFSMQRNPLRSSQITGGCGRCRAL